MRKTITLMFALPLASVALAQVPGLGVGAPVAPDRDLNTVVITETGHITLSSDGLGTMADAGLLQIDKPSAGATVRAAFLAAANTGGTAFDITNGCITLDGVGINWSAFASQPYPFLNYWADVTGIVSNALVGAPAGINDITVSECNTFGVDGTALYVIFDDPATTITRTAVIAFGAQVLAGDQFHIGFGQPVTVDGNTVIEMGLADSYSYQDGDCQTSTIDVNGQRLTTSAGGNDDGDYANGALMTVGGIGDNLLNPADPNFQCDGSDVTFYDDELYNIAGYVNTGDTGVLVNTFNPSYNDNIFVAHLLLDFAAVVGEGAVLTPAEAVNCLGEPHTVTISVQDDNGQPVAGREAMIHVISGPNAGQESGVQLTDGNGQVSFTYTSYAEGTDTLLGMFVNNAGAMEYSNYAYKVWRNCDVEAGETAEGFNLAQNSPNPFNPSTTISFNMPETAAARLNVYTVGGQLVQSIDLGLAPRGVNQIQFDGASLSSGIYVYALETEFGTLSNKMLLIK